MHPRSYIVLDALDECSTTGQPEKRHNIMQVFGSILNLGVSAKIFISSRYEADIAAWAKAWTMVPITPAYTEADLNLFVDCTIETELAYKENCDDTLRAQLKERLKGKSNGKLVDSAFLGHQSLTANVLCSFRWAQVSLGYICEPGRPSFQLLQVLESIPSELNEFYFTLLTEVKSDRSPFNREIGLRAIKLLLAMTAVQVSLKSDAFLKAVCECTKWRGIPLNVGLIKTACHHLVAFETTVDEFEFGHFSVTEFFQAKDTGNAYREELDHHFGLPLLWPEISAMCAARVVAKAGGGSGGGTARGNKGSQLLWAMLFANLRYQALTVLSGLAVDGPLPVVLPGGEEIGSEPAEALRGGEVSSRVKCVLSIVGNGVDINTATDASLNSVAWGSTFSPLRGSDDWAPWFVSPRASRNHFDGTDLLQTVFSIAPHSDLAILCAERDLNVGESPSQQTCRVCLATNASTYLGWIEC